MSDNPLEFGIGPATIESSYYYPKAWASVYRDDLLEEVQLAERLGYETYWLAEHHHAYSGYVPSSMQAAAACIAATDEISVGPGVMLLPLQGAARTAEMAAAIDAVSPGRLRMAMGMGYAEREFDAGGVERKRRGRIFEEDLVQLTRDHLERIGATEVWVGGHADKAIQRAARFGCSLYFTNQWEIDWHKRVREMWEAALQPLPNQKPRIGLLNPIWVSHDKKDVERARRRLTENFVHYTHYMAKDIYMEFDPDSGNVQIRASPDGPLFDPVASGAFGTPEEVVEQLAPLITEAGVDGMYFYIHTPAVDGAEMKEQITLIAEEVLPGLRSLR
jgi:alkanesulfonate monooxygenase SsuD/methylene tetrahydromethanopterin reductase-like flavin-dependent oxidoreductase (luciferase family)